MILLTDIHGCYDTMIALLAQIPQEEKNEGIVICGDLIDRGPKSKQIIQYCIDNNIQVVLGNHEEMFMDSWNKIVAYIEEHKEIPEYWQLEVPFLNNGGYETLMSYVTDGLGLDVTSLEEHLQWFSGLPYYIEFPEIKNDEGRYLVVSHSNIGNVWKLREDTDPQKRQRFLSEITWGRPGNVKDVPEIYNVIGHTPQDFEARIRKIYANIDTGCVYSNSHNTMYGKLTALSFPSMQIWTQENLDD